MKNIIKYGIAYLCLAVSDIILIILILDLFDYIQMTDGDRFFLIFIVNAFCMYIYHKYKPFKLTGDLDLKIKRFFNSYFESQKSCPNCDRVVKASELTPDGKCIYCKEEKNIK
jgi:hypothetical protein